jgi:AraC-like DNA-binding protein
MSTSTVHIESISQLHQIVGIAPPVHPLISLIDAREIQVLPHQVGKEITYNLYMISAKDKACAIDYGLNPLDFNEGVLTFSSPGQTYTTRETISKGEIQGWLLYIHPDLVKGTFLENQMHEYSFFNYDVFEALHLSAQEQQTIEQNITNITQEYSQRIDNHSQRVIVSNIALLLDYCMRFYERQFNTRTSKSQEVVHQFKQELNNYFAVQLAQNGIPSTSYFADQANLSKHYFSDLLKKETGKTPKEFINLKLVDQAKYRLTQTAQSINEIAYDLGFNYPHYFTRVFKAHTGTTPLAYRNAN